MRVIGITPWDNGAIVELNDREHQAIGDLVQAIDTDRRSPGQLPSEDTWQQAFSLIKDLAAAIKQQNFSDESVKRIVLGATEAKTWAK